MNRSRLAFAIWILFGLVCLALGIWFRAREAPEWLRPEPTQHSTVGQAAFRPWMVEADCYSQMARVQRILQGQGLIQNHFTVENWPEGLTPSTTATFDYCILLLYAPLKLITTDPLDWAGVLVSPVLWGALILFWLLFRSREFSLAGRAVLLAGATALPALVWATAFGRPRHQSLILLLLAIGFTAEYERWNMVVTPRKAWSVFAGVIWGLACWTSLFEPLLVVVVLIAFNLLVRRRESAVLLVSFGGVMLLALLLEGFHIYIPPAPLRPYLANWLGTIAEVRGLSFTGMAKQMSFGLLLLFFVAWPLWTRPNANRTDRLLILLTLLLTIFTFLQMRWVVYASLGEIFVIARYFQLAPVRWPQLIVISLFGLGLVAAASDQIDQSRRAVPNQPSPQLLLVGRSIDAPGAILAPWWLSPGLLYFSGHPIVTGSSHCGISGIVAGARFYSTTSWVEAEKILKERQVSWVVVADDPRYDEPLLNSSRRVLGLPFLSEDDAAQKLEADRSVAQILIEDRFVPTWLQLRDVTPQLKLYRYVPTPER